MEQRKESNWEWTQDQINAYLTGRLDDAQREAFELRMFAEPELSAEVERAAELMALYRGPDGVSASRRTPWMPLAAAAAVAALAIGIWINAPRIEPPPVDTPGTTRGHAQSFPVDVSPADDGVTVSWAAVPEATSYELRIYLEDGSVVYERALPGATTGHLVALDALVTGRKVLRVRALDSFRDIQADSGLIPVPED